MKISDIEGTKAKARHAVRGTGEKLGTYDPFNYRDVTHCDFRTTRTTNPLNPTYVAQNEDGKVISIGDVHGSHPCVLPPAR